MSITINGATNTLTAASGLNIAGNTAVTGTLSSTGILNVGTNKCRVSPTGAALQGILAGVQIDSYDDNLSLFASPATPGTNTFQICGYTPDSGGWLSMLETSHVASGYPTVKIGQGASGFVGTFSSTGLAVTGLLDLSAASSGQIKFPATQNASADANTLDDYEEGTWTPVLTYETPGTLAVTQANHGFYTKIGRQVTVQFTVRLSAFTKGTASGNLLITGLPFTVAADEQAAVVAIGTYDAPFTTQPLANASGTSIALLRIVGGAAWVSLDDPDANSQYLGQLTYHV